MSVSPLQRTSLYAVHAALGARLIPFAGWELPVQYPAGPLQEHRAVREAAGLFDIGHMGRLRLTGPDARRLLQKLLTRNLARSQPGVSTYGLMTYADGTILDDVIVNHRQDGWVVVANGANRAKVQAWLRAHAYGHEVDLADDTLREAMFACQGPQAVSVLSRVFDVGLAPVPRFRGRDVLFQGQTARLTRTGYTGEDGFEIMCPAGVSADLFQRILAAGAPHGLLPCGLAARDSLRLEAGYPLYGHEISSDINPLEAALGWAVSFRKPDFVGRAALLKCKLEGPRRTLIGFAMREPGMPRAGYRVLHAANVVGRVTSGNKSPTLDRFIGLALVQSDARGQTELDIDIRGRCRRAQVVPTPFLSQRP